MDDLEERLRRYADANVAATTPVTADEARARASRRPPRSRLWMVAAAAAVIGLVAAGVALNRGGTVKQVTANGDYPLTLDGQTQWQLAVINSAIHPSDAEYRSRYSPRFVAAVPVSKFRSSVDTVARRGPWRVLTEIERRDDRVLAVQLAAPNGEQARLTLYRTTDGRFDGSTILFATPCAPAVDAATPLSAELGDQLAWIRGVLASSARVSDAELEE